jgi:hypothetical protein
VTSAEAITAELRALGFKGDAQTVRRYLKPFRLPGTSRSHPDPHQRKPTPAAPAVPKPRKISKALLTHPDDLTEDDALIVKNAIAGCAHLERLHEHVRSFAKIMAQRRGTELRLNVVTCSSPEPNYVIAHTPPARSARHTNTASCS